MKILSSAVLPEMLPKIDVLVSDLTQKIRNDFYELNMKQLKWVSSVTIDYLRSVGLDLGAVYQKTDDFGNSMLHKLVQIRDIKPLKLLISKFNNVNIQNDKQETPLHIACKVGNKASAKVLLSYFAEIDVKDQNGNTPLMNVASQKNPDVSFLNFLLRNGADLCMENNFNEKAWDIATTVKSKDKVLRLLNPYYR